jgi:hypothetical protein
VESLDSILKGKEAPVVEQPKVEAPVEQKAEAPTETPEQRADRERDEKGRFKAKEQAEQAPAKPETPKAPEPPKVEVKPAPTAAETVKPAITPEAPPQVPVKALQEERRKRQELERQLAAIQQPQKAPDVATDPQGFQRHISETLQSQSINMRVDMSAAMARRQYQDFDSVMEAWYSLKDENPHLYQQAIQQELPADWAYNYVKRHQLMEKMGNDPDAYIAAEVEKRLKERQPEVPQAPARPAAPVPPPSLANAPSGAAVVSTAKTFDGPTPFKSIIRR